MGQRARGGDGRAGRRDPRVELDRGEVPPEVVIDEAVGFAKRYATEEAGRLVNGILGRIQREAVSR